MIFWFVPFSGIVALIFALFFYRSIMKQEEGTSAMKQIASAVREGAITYIKQQYKIVALFFIIACIFLSFLAFVLKVQSPWTPFAFLTGGFFSALSGYIGMATATRASSRTTNGARKSLNQALKIAFRSGAVMGLVVVGLGLFDISIWFIVLRILLKYDLRIVTTTMLSFGMGASLQALFARVGGGIFTKAADVGADLVGKVEAGIPEDDSRNPAVIADNVGDNVGDVCGMGADLYESYCGSILSAAALGAAAFYGTSLISNAVILPMLVAGIGIFLSIFGIFMVRTREGATQKMLLKALGRGVNFSALSIVILTALAVKFLLPGHFGIWIAIVIGLVVGIVIGKNTEYYTSSEFKPTQEVVCQSKTGPATVIITGLANGMLSSMVSAIAIGAGILGAFAVAGGFDKPIFGLYGIGIAAVGMLSTLGITLASDAYGPVADNAGGNAQMSKLDAVVRKRTDTLDELGNTTAATGKGFAIGSAALTALALLAAYIEEVRIGLERIGVTILKIGDRSIETGSATLRDFMEYFNVHLMNPGVIIGIFIGSMAAFVFAGLIIKAVGKAAGKMVEEVRRQFREIPGLMSRASRPDYGSCVSISTKAAQKEMILPAALAVMIPIIIGLILGVSGVMGLLMGVIGTGFILAIFMANAGGSWDNAKKFIEKGHYGGKGSEAHKATVVGDTVGDPLKDSAGPSLNILIKLMSMVSIVVAGLIVAYHIF